MKVDDARAAKLQEWLRGDQWPSIDHILVLADLLSDRAERLARIAALSKALDDMIYEARRANFISRPEGGYMCLLCKHETETLAQLDDPNNHDSDCAIAQAMVTRRGKG